MSPAGETRFAIMNLCRIMDHSRQNRRATALIYNHDSYDKSTAPCLDLVKGLNACACKYEYVLTFEKGGGVTSTTDVIPVNVIATHRYNSS